MSSPPPTPPARLRRELGVGDAIVIGLGSMIGAGIFVALAPAAAAAGSGLLIGLVVAALVAYCNATSSARLAARHPTSGGTYVYGRERLGDFWGYQAGWMFVVGKTASGAAMALTVGVYLWPGQAHAVAAATVVAITALNYLGVQKSAWVSRLIVAFTLAVLTLVIVTSVGSGSADPGSLAIGSDIGVLGVLQAAAILFFAFAGYARIATLGEEVRSPTRAIPRAILGALGITLAVYAAVAVTAVAVLGPQTLAHESAPLVALVRTAGMAWMEPVVRVAAAVAAIGALVAMILGISRTVLAMARNGHLPRTLAAVHPRRHIPHRAEIVVGAVVAVVAAAADVRTAIGFSSFGVLLYYALANASAWTLSRSENRPPRIVPVVGFIGCIMLAAVLPIDSVIGGAAVAVVGGMAYLLRRRE